ncbi:MAG: hypothetical protein ACFBSC_11170 [Microcoleaceae cyanobacterium]
MDKAITPDQTPPQIPSSSYAPSVPISLYREVSAELQTHREIIESIKVENQQLLQQTHQLRQELGNNTQAAGRLQQAVNTAQKGNQTNVQQLQSLAANSPSIPDSNPTLDVSPSSTHLQSIELPSPSLSKPDVSFTTSSQSLNSPIDSSSPLPPSIDLPNPQVQQLSKPAAKSIRVPSRWVPPQPTQIQSNLSPASAATPEPALPFSPDDQPSTPEVSERLFTEEPEGRYRSRQSENSRTELSGLWLAVSIALIVIVGFAAGYWIVRPILQQQNQR